jgi:proline iminopeptidase
LHGGPGSGFSPGQRRFFDPDAYRVVLFDQRGSGRRRPLATAPDADLSANTTDHLIADIEALRQLHGVERWTILGISWGTTLGLAYAQTHLRRVDALVLALVTTTSRREVEWITHGVGRIFPGEWNRFVTAVPDRLRHLPLTDAYATLLFNDDPAVRDHAARAWCAWEDAHVSLAPAISQIRAMKIPSSASSSHALSRTTGGTPPSWGRTNSFVMQRHCAASPAS